METEPVKVSGITRLAVQTFEQHAKAERKMRELEEKSNALIVCIPEEEMDYYVEKTQKIANQEDEKLETFMRRLEKRARRAQQWELLRQKG